MSNEVAIQSVAPVRIANDTVGEVNTVPQQPSPVSQPVAQSPPIYNPSVRFDSSLGLVVIEFRNDSGSVTTQVPSQQQLDAYQRWNTTRLGPVPAGLHAPPTPVAAAPVVKPQPRTAPPKGTSVTS
jgi:hypothetical protein